MSIVKYAVTTQNLCPSLDRQISAVIRIKETYTFQCSHKIESNRKANNSVLHLMKDNLAKYLVYTFNSVLNKQFFYLKKNHFNEYFV